MDLGNLRERLAAHQQDGALRFWERLSEEEQKQLYNDVSSINMEELNRYYRECNEDLAHAGAKVDDQMQPLPSEVLGSIVRTEPHVLHSYEEKGLQEISKGNVAVLLMAGGQGTRLGVAYPKGMYDVGLPSHKTLFQLQAERIVKIQQIAQERTGNEGHVPWYIMTSEATQEPTRQFFQKNNYFGLKSDNVTFFEQNTLPCLTMEGKIILEKPSKLARAPDGNGGLYRALGNSGVLDDIVNRGIKFLHVYCVDNILVKMADPVFIGFCIEKNACCGAKVVEKAFPTEAVGVICKLAGDYHVVEYSEITLPTAERRNTDGRLTFSAGNICNHFFTVDFLKTIVREKDSSLRHHVAKKKIPFADGDGQTIKPSQPNGIKMEKFVFDVFQHAKNFAVWEVLREDEFSPLKNADGAPKDTPTTSRHSVFNLHMRKVLNAGGQFQNEDGSAIPHIQSNGQGDAQGTASSVNGNSHREEADEPVVCEISPLLSYAGEGLEEIVKGKKFLPPLVLKSPGETGKDSMVISQ